ncbi:hypothetical protein [Agromyces sp. LHK192]|uniref:hypothetical protein n=1 Tax=Agromyces sp. LHK192 TaxID=2498704 RepID=UPI000FD73B7B|nr:hypothetical protein [Agromyces sp. LHK192]
MGEFRYCGRFSETVQQPPSDPEWTWIEEAEALRRFQTIGAELTVVAPADPSGFVPFAIVVTCGPVPSYTVRRFLAPAFCDLELWWGGTADGLFLDTVVVDVYPDAPDEFDQPSITTTLVIDPSGSGALRRFVRSQGRTGLPEQQLSSLPGLDRERLFRSQPAWGEWQGLLDLTVFADGATSAAEIDEVLARMPDASGAVAGHESGSRESATDSASAAEDARTSEDASPLIADLDAWPAAGSGGFRFCGAFDPVRQDVAAGSSWLTEAEARVAMADPDAELTLVGPLDDGVPRVLVVVSRGTERVFEVIRQSARGLADLIMWWRASGEVVVLDAVAIQDFEESARAGDAPVFVARTDIDADGARRLTLTSAGSATEDIAEMDPIDAADRVRPMPEWGEWAELLDAPAARAR